MSIDDYYDAHPVFSTSAADIERRACDQLLQMAGCVASIDQTQVLLDWRLLAKRDSQILLTVSGVLFLASRPQHFLPDASILVMRVPGLDANLERCNQKRFEGRVLDLIEDTERFLDIHLPRPNSIPRAGPEAALKFPSHALREAIVNAIAHRDYTISAPIRIIIHDARVEFHTPGQLPTGITLESLPLGMHVLRNPIIYAMLYRTKFVADAGNGIPRMIRQTREFTGREPGFHLEGNELVLSLPRRNPPATASPA